MLPATGQTLDTLSPEPANQSITQRQEHKGEEHPADTGNDWLRRELEMLFRLREKGTPFEDISQKPSQLGPQRSVERRAMN